LAKALMPTQALILIGYRGTGKTTVAGLLATPLGSQAVDLDEEIERAAGKTIAEIFAQHGEESFREQESAALARCVARERIVLATGGGVILREANRQQLRDIRDRGGRVVWLRASPETIQRRLAADASSASRRPNLTAGGGLREIVELLARRTPFYQACASLTVDTEGKTPEQVAAEILQALPRPFREAPTA
jgi:shikimate kinase